MPPDREAAPWLARVPGGSTAALGRSLNRTAPPNAGPRDDDAIAQLRLNLYTVALGIAFALYLVAEGSGQGAWFWACAVGIALALAGGVVLRGPLLRVGALAAVALAMAVPLGPALAAGTSLAVLIGTSPLWSQILVTLFASRVLTEEGDVRFARFWRAPLQSDAPVRIQSMGASFALGACLTLLFYQGLAWVAPGHSTDTSFSAIVTNALTGETVVHRAIVFLFFVIVAYLLEAAIQHRRDRAVFRAVRSTLKTHRDRGTALDGTVLVGLLAETLSEFSHARAVRLIEDAYDRVAPDRSAARALTAASFSAFHLSSRRFIRGLLPFLPMLGFFGTVVGLATAMAALPTDATAGSTVDISGSLAGLAVKFQTTMLGILASLIAGTLLSLLDKSEMELAAECALVVAAIEAREHA